MPIAYNDNGNAVEIQSTSYTTPFKWKTYYKTMRDLEKRKVVICVTVFNADGLLQILNLNPLYHTCLSHKRVDDPTIIDDVNFTRPVSLHTVKP